MVRLLLLILALSLAIPERSLACGADTDCIIGDRIYRIRLPKTHSDATPAGAIVFAHGYRGTARGVMRNKALWRMAEAQGLALIGLKSKSADWKIPGTPSNPSIDGSVEFDYVDAVIADVKKRFGLDSSRFLATGFSAGGMMVWNLACHRSDRFIGFAPISGTFWQPEPTTCTSPPGHVVHIHGNADRTVPLLGRPIATTHQGRVPQVLEMYADYGGYTPRQPYQTERLSCETALNPAGRILQFCLFEGGHSFSSKDVAHAWEQILSAEKTRQ